jgi:hypothetical protein
MRPTRRWGTLFGIDREDRAMDGWLDPGEDASGAQGVELGANLCPACGMVAAVATSRYCGRHIAELRAQWWAFRSLRLGSRAA